MGTGNGIDQQAYCVIDGDDSSHDERCDRTGWPSGSRGGHARLGERHLGSKSGRESGIGNADSAGTANPAANLHHPHPVNTDLGSSNFGDSKRRAIRFAKRIHDAVNVIRLPPPQDADQIVVLVGP